MAQFHKADVVVGNIYLVKVSGREVPVQIRRKIQAGGKQQRMWWLGVNLITNREVTIKSAAKLRKLITLTDYERYGLTV